MLAELVGSRLRARVLGWLFTHPDERYFVRQLTALLDEDSTNLSRELARLERLGLLTCRAEGRQKYYQADPACPVASELRGLAIKTMGLADVLRAALAPLRKQIRVAFLYGSAARGTLTRDSDVDVMVIGEASPARIARALHPAQGRLARAVNASVYPAREFRAKRAAGHHFLTEVARGTKVYLIGGARELEELGG